ncbi:MAG: hypothetical protein AAGA25_00985 [Planctomycetota bacterium]
MPAEGGSGKIPPAIQVEQTFGDDQGFEFYLPADDSTHTVIDLSHLNDPQADRQIIVRDGRYTYADTGESLRLFGVNVGPDDAFLEYAESDLMAARLAKLGVNIVRLHHLDNMWARQSGGTLWPAEGPLDHFRADSLDKLGYLVSALKQHGIYCNLNLKVSKHLGPEDGVPESNAFVHQKRVDRFYRPMIEHQKWYARELLTWVNPHTGLTFAEDPAIALIEINNENSIMHLWTGQPLGEGWERLSDYYENELSNQWHGWLKDKYTNDAALKTAWRGSDAGQSQPRASVKPRRWLVNGMRGSEVSLEPAQDGVAITVNKATGSDWHAQALWNDIELQRGESYTLILKMSADQERAVRISVDRQVDGTYGNVGLNRSIKLTKEAQTYELPFAAVDPDTANRIALNLGAVEDTARYKIHSATLRPGWLTSGFEGSIADGGFNIDGPRSPQQRRDWFEFLIETEQRGSDEMRAFLREELDIKKPMMDSQIQWGQSSALERERLGQDGGSQFVETHTYWQHPSFGSSGDWNPTDWTIANSSIVEALARGETGPFGMAPYRVKGYPFGVSEIDQAAPSDWAVELLPLTATFAAAQDWDALYLFTQGNPDPDIPGIQGFFDQIKHTSKAGQYPAAALIFRKGLIPPAHATRTLVAPSSLWQVAERQAEAWRVGSPDVIKPEGLLNYRLSIDVKSSTNEAIHMEERPGSTPLTLRSGSSPLYTAVSDHAAVAVGFLNTVPIKLGDTKLDVSPNSIGFGAISLVPLDGKPLKDSGRMLLTVIGRAQNQAMGWNSSRTSVSDQWGYGPMLVQIPELTVTLPQPGLQAWALTPTGERQNMIPINGKTLRVTAEHETIYYEISRRDD